MPFSIETVIDSHITARIKETGRLATLPQVTWELMRILSDEGTTPDDLQTVVEQDPALSAKVISLGNSSYYGMRTSVSTIARAIVIIGFRELEFLAMGLGLADTFDLRQVPYGFDGQSLWLHSLSVSWTAREVAVATRLVEPGEAMLAGLVHNIGQIMLVTHFRVQLQKLMHCVHKGCSYAQAEAELGLWHEIIGYMLARNWGMPKYLEDAILYHHRPEAATELTAMIQVINLAVQLVDKTDFRLEYEDPHPHLYHETLPQMELDAKMRLLEKMKMTFPLMAPAWLHMLGVVKKDEA